jgi:hypothetical protein
MSDPKFVLVQVEESIRPKASPVEHGAREQQWIPASEVLPHMPHKWDRRRKMKALKDVGVCRRIGPRRCVVILGKLKEKLPEIYQSMANKEQAG